MYQKTNIKHRASGRGFTLVEVMVAASATVIVAIGTLSYQYYSVKHSRASQAQIMATRIAQLIIEDWKSAGGDAAYDPTLLGLGFQLTDPEDYGQYWVTFDNQTFYIQLTPEDLLTDPVPNITLRQINVRIRWRNDFSAGALSANDSEISLTTYVRSDV